MQIDSSLSAYKKIRTGRKSGSEIRARHCLKGSGDMESLWRLEASLFLELEGKEMGKNMLQVKYALTISLVLKKPWGYSAC